MSASESSPVVPTTGQGPRRTGPLALLVLWPVVVLLVGGGLGYRALLAEFDARFERELAVRPPLAVIDPSEFVAVGADPQSIEAGLRAAIAAADKLGAAGYVVVDKQAVLASPAESRVPPP